MTNSRMSRSKNALRWSIATLQVGGLALWAYLLVVLALIFALLHKPHFGG